MDPYLPTQSDMASLLHPLHGVLLLETIAFLVYVERRPETSPWLVGIGHVIAAVALIVTGFVSNLLDQAIVASSGSGAELEGSGLVFLVLGLLPLFVAGMLRRKRTPALRVRPDTLLTKRA